MNTKAEKQILKAVIEKYGSTLQKTVAMEEMAELIQALSKDLRGKTNRNNIVEEVVDVWIMLLQLIMIYDISDSEFYETEQKKVMRMRERINDTQS